MSALAGYGQIAYLLYPPTLRAAGAAVHHELARSGLIVIDPEPSLPDDERGQVAALELAKMRRADQLDVVHGPGGCLDEFSETVLQRATDLGKRVRHHYIDARCA